MFGSFKARSLLVVALSTCVMASMAGCSKKEVGFDTLETARKQAKENAEFNARAFRAQTPALAELGIISRGDSTQSPACPQGDGWASIDLIDPKTTQTKASLKCSTVSDSVGCRTAVDFKSSSYANEEGNCQSVAKVPHPLPKISK